MRAPEWTCSIFLLYVFLIVQAQRHRLWRVDPGVVVVHLSRKDVLVVGGRALAGVLLTEGELGPVFILALLDDAARKRDHLLTVKWLGHPWIIAIILSLRLVHLLHLLLHTLPKLGERLAALRDRAALDLMLLN